ncbi:uncharacterized protein zmp:0000000930 [Plectropomus leopardus]|uniref:uncharacterized protein zmp:0000000930 n=1 Tax=Plectropomus leopardus TaxID=160734 RepID=UPI001C4D00FA|nr:uncharacterized protein zmp:0000000930 [Plectropomus leopardus]
MNCVSRGGCYLVNSYCELQEENQWRKESYEAYWLSVVLETRPQYKLTLSETDNIRKESYKQQQVTHFTVERSPSQILRLGSNSTGMTEHRLPLFNIGKDLRRATTTFGRTGRPVPEDNRVVKREMTVITRDSSKPVRVNFRASSLMSSPRETSHRVKRRE